MTLCRVLLVVSIVFVPGAGVWAGPRADDPDAEATGEPAPGADLTPAVHGPVAPGGPAGEPAAPRQTAAATGNNIIGLNVARLRRDRYIWAAAELVNANGGDWGYLTVVFTASERDSAQGEQLLQELLDRCYEAHLQPIVRVATSFDPETETWSRPGPDDPEKWRAFLERGRWPTKRVWVIAGNEPNLGREWGGEVDSAGYAEYLSRFLDVFADSPRFKVVNGPLDASNTTEMPKMQDAYEFLAGMEEAVPGIFSRLAGWASNPYSVPHQGPGLRYTHLAYESELEAIGRDMPVLITEAGHLNTGDEREIAAFYEQAFRDWMADPRVVAVTPLFWHPDRGVYWMFDFDKNNQVIDKSPTYELIQRLPRPRGSPLYEPDIENVPRGEPPAEARAEPRIAELALRPQAGELPPVAADVPLDPTPEPTATATPTPPPPTATPTATPVPPTATAASVPPAGMPATPTRPPATSTRPPATATPAPTAPPPAPTSAPAPASASARFMRIGNTDGGAVRMRSTPARSAPAIASVPTGTRVQALGTAERHEDLHWQRVRVPDGAEGWIPIDFLVPE